MTPGDPVTPMTPGDPVTHAQGGAAQQDVRGMQDVGRMQAAVIGHVPPVAQLQRPRGNIAHEAASGVGRGGWGIERAEGEEHHQEPSGCRS